ncbi:MAG: radical SAM protein [Candidatus Methanoperedens sp.]
MIKRILLVNPAKQDNFVVNRIHMGLSLIGEILARNGYTVKIMDYAFLRGIRDKIEVPTIEQVIHEFKPDLIGISVFTYVYDECKILIDKISGCCDIPIILGGPHFTMYPSDFRTDSRISYIIRGEADSIILNLIASATREQSPVFIDSSLPSPEEIPSINLDIAFGSEYLSVYQIQLSRGCPYNCSFCIISSISGCRVRYRDVNTCLHQIVEAKRRHPKIQTIVITDDCPTSNMKRFKNFLKLFSEANTGCDLAIDNMRANLIDEELIQLYVAAGGQNICLGVESGHPEVFELIHKGESLKDVKKAARLIKKNKLILGLCFVIGLPGDNLERHLYSLKFAKSLKPDYIFWNMCIPWPGTEINQWYEKNGTLGDLRNFSTLIDPKVYYKPPPASSFDFPAADRIKAWLMANMETYWFPLSSIKKIIIESYKYKLYRSIGIYITGYIPHLINNRNTLLHRNLQQFGIKTLLLKLLRKAIKS